MTALDTAIASLPRGPSRFQHVCKHLYCLKERWDFVVPDLPGKPRDKARQSGCPNISLRRGDYHGACEPCRAHVLTDHDRYYEPAYREALATAIAANRSGVVLNHSRHSELFVGNNGVMVVVNKVRRTGERQVATAYRVVPAGLPPHAHTREAFFQAAERKLRDKTGGGRR